MKPELAHVLVATGAVDDDAEAVARLAGFELVVDVGGRPCGRLRDGDATRLMSRLRDRGGVLLVHGPWPRAEARLSLGEVRWSGVGAGSGHLTSREAGSVGGQMVKKMIEAYEQGLQ